MNLAFNCFTIELNVIFTYDRKRGISPLQMHLNNFSPFVDKRLAYHFAATDIATPVQTFRMCFVESSVHH